MLSHTIGEHLISSCDDLTTPKERPARRVRPGVPVDASCQQLHFSVFGITGSAGQG